MSESEVLSALQLLLFTPLHIQNLFHLFAIVKKLVKLVKLIEFKGVG
jgi:hypothetical protein